MNFLLAGMKHCGKSTHGRSLSRALKCPFYDTDDLIIEDHQKRTGEDLTVREFYKKYGAEGFQKAEARVFKELCSRLRGRKGNTVISLGGRLACNPDLDAQLRSFGTFVYIKTEPDILYPRVMKNGHPPFLSDEDPYNDFVRICKEREPYFERYSDITLELEDESLPVVKQKVIDKIKEYINAW